MTSVELASMTKKMQDLYIDIIGSLGQLPEEQRVFLFGAEGEEDWDWITAIADYITLEYIKYSFDKDDPEYSIRHYLGAEADDSERMMQSRIAQYVANYKKRSIQQWDPEIPADHKFASLDMTGIEQKLKGYRLTEMNFFEHQVIHDIDIIKAVVEKRIGSAKKISNSRFVEIFTQYDAFVERLIERSKESDADMVFASLAFFTLEWHYALETLYHVSWLMEGENIEKVDLDSLALLCGHVTIQSDFGGQVTTQSRMVKERQGILEALLDKEIDKICKDSIESLSKELVVLSVQYKECLESAEGGLYKDWFAQQSEISDWASFLRYYDVFSIWQRKRWTKTRIRNMRYLLNEMFVKPL